MFELAKVICIAEPENPGLCCAGELYSTEAEVEACVCVFVCVRLSAEPECSETQVH